MGLFETLIYLIGVFIVFVLVWKIFKKLVVAGILAVILLIVLYFMGLL